MKFRHGVAVLALASAFLVVAAGVALLRDGRNRSTVETALLPRAGLVVAACSARLGPSLASLDLSPFWTEVLRPAAAARRLTGDAPAALGIYGREWLVLASRPFRPEPAVSGRRGLWNAAASTPDRLPRSGEPELPVALPRVGTAILWARPLAAGAADGTTWHGALPERADGILDPNSGRETWRLACRGPCLLDALRPEPASRKESSLWDGVPPEAVAIAEVAFDPALLEAALDLTLIADAERFLGLPVRREAARTLTGRATLALIEEPALGSPAALLASLELAQADAARALLDRALALGVLSGEIGIERYRDVTVGSWTRSVAGTGLRPAVAVDGDVLLAAARKRDLLAAVDRRRRPREAASAAREALEAIGPGAWRGWSRSSFLCSSWFELLTGRRAEPPLPASEVAARVLRRDGVWVLESRGTGPAFAAEPVLPAIRSAVRAARVGR